MMNAVNLTRRDRRRKLKDGAVVIHTRWVLNYREPRTGQRRQLFFERQKDAQLRRNEIVTQVETGVYLADRHKNLTVADAAKRWLASREGEVKLSSLDGYRRAIANIVGPLVLGTPRERGEYTVKRQQRAARAIPLLGNFRVQELSTSDIRTWHKTLATEVGWYSANRAKMFLAAVLALAAEDMNIRPPVMPTKLGRGKPKSKKLILTTDQVTILLRAAREDREKGIYVAFPFLTGTRPSEQLGLLWRDIDFAANLIRIRRMQERSGIITNLTKTVAGTREIQCAACCDLCCWNGDWHVLAWMGSSTECFLVPDSSSRGRCRVSVAAARCSMQISVSGCGCQR
jgi:hypothetical protein